MTIGSTSTAAPPFQGFGISKERENDRPGAVIERQEKTDPFRRDDEQSRPTAVETQPSSAAAKRSEAKGRGGKIDFVV